MSYVWQRWLADEFRAAGLKVVEIEGWKNRGRPASAGHFNPTGPSTAHHTGAYSSQASPSAGLSLLINGRSDLPGPLCHWATGYDGTVYVIAAGRANHAGKVGREGARGMPLGADGNTLALGNEVMTDGTQPIPRAQSEAIALAHAVASLHYDKDESWVHRHADISGSGKWDLGQKTTTRLRAEVGRALREVRNPAILPTRVRKARAQITAEIQRIRAAKKVAKSKGEDLAYYTASILALKNARRRLGKVPKR